MKFTDVYATYQVDSTDKEGKTTSETKDLRIDRIEGFLSEEQKSNYRFHTLHNKGAIMKGYNADGAIFKDGYVKSYNYQGYNLKNQYVTDKIMQIRFVELVLDKAS